MRKLVLIFLVFISVFSFSNENFTRNEKNVILKQFAEFQNAVKNKDVKTIEKFIESIYKYLKRKQNSSDKMTIMCI